MDETLTPHTNELPRGDSGKTLGTPAQRQFVLHRTINGWIVGESEYIHKSDLPNLRVFNTMRDLAAYLVRASGEKPRIVKLPARDSKGHFLPSHDRQRTN